MCKSSIAHCRENRVGYYILFLRLYTWLSCMVALRSMSMCQQRKPISTTMKEQRDLLQFHFVERKCVVM